jgi:hypothetical protein
MDFIPGLKPGNIVLNLVNEIIDLVQYLVITGTDSDQFLILGAVLLPEELHKQLDVGIGHLLHNPYFCYQFGFVLINPHRGGINPRRVWVVGVRIEVIIDYPITPW